MIVAHLSGPRVSALLDGQLSRRESEEAWAHVYACHPCRDLVEREGWVKARLAGLAGGSDDPTVPSTLKGSLLSMPPADAMAPDERRPTPWRGVRRPTGPAVLVGGSALGAAVLGVVALGSVPGPSTPPAPPVTRITAETTAPTPVPSTPADVTTPVVAPGTPLDVSTIISLLVGPQR